MGYMKLHKYSLMVLPLAEGTFLSGRGMERTYLVTVFYDPIQEERTFRALRTVGVDLRSAPEEPCGQDLADVSEQIILNSAEVQCIVAEGLYQLDKNIFETVFMK